MTKEEIIAQHVVSERKISDFNQSAAYDFKYITVPNARIAMEEYAKQQAIAFYIFTETECYKYSGITNTWHQFSYDNVPVSYEEVYGEFLEQQNKSNGKMGV